MIYAVFGIALFILFMASFRVLLLALINKVIDVTVLLLNLKCTSLLNTCSYISIINHERQICYRFVLMSAVYFQLPCKIEPLVLNGFT